MWFQLYGFVNLQPYIIHEFIFHVFFFLPPHHHHTQGLQSRIVNEDYGQIFGFFVTFFPPGFSLDGVDGFKSSRLTIVIYGDYKERGLSPKAVAVYV